MPEVFRPQLATDEFGDSGDLLDLLTSRPGWMAYAACAEPHPGVTFFPERGESTAAAKRVCAGCLCLHECRAWAMNQDTGLQGIWGGWSAQERKAARRASAA